jgi:hypothetical protein
MKTRSTRGALRHAVVVDVEVTDSQFSFRCHLYVRGFQVPVNDFFRAPLQAGFVHFSGGTFCFSSSNQFSTTLICVAAVCACSAGLSIKNRWPFGETS